MLSQEYVFVRIGLKITSVEGMLCTPVQKVNL